MRLRKGRTEDLPFIRRGAAAWRLDDERLAARQFVVAVDEAGRRVGFGRVKPYEGFHELGTVGVAPRWRGRGVGELIVRRLIRDFPDRVVWITTDLIAYFERFGFRLRARGPLELGAKIRDCRREKGRRGMKLMSLLKTLLLAVGCGPLVSWTGAPMRLSRHAAERVEQRKVRCETLKLALKECKPFPYRHEGREKTGCYREGERLFVATEGVVVLTVIKDAAPSYVERLKAKR